jgi:hypothetical protein
MFVLKVLILVILPYGTAILFGAASERWGGKNLSALLSMAGLVWAYISCTNRLSCFSKQ